MLPAAEIDPKDLQVIAKGTDTLTHTYSLLRPILEKMQQAGWRIQETIDEKTCPNCQGTGKVDDGYNCRDCAGQGRIKTVALSGSFQNKSFKFTALG
jgi:RecJ-like exonuclease